MCEMQVITTEGEVQIFDEATVAAFEAGLRGDLLRPGTDGYESARQVWNGTFDRRPALIARRVGSRDVIDAVNFAREHNLLIAVKAAGITWPATPCAMAT